jgi:hypothetical protein
MFVAATLANLQNDKKEKRLDRWKGKEEAKLASVAQTCVASQETRRRYKTSTKQSTRKPERVRRRGGIEVESKKLQQLFCSHV